MTNRGVTFQKIDGNLVRDKIEDIVKKKNIVQSQFCEFPKLKYEKILEKFYFTFCDCENFTPSVISFERGGLHFRGNLESYCIAGVLQSENWSDYLGKIESEISDGGKLILILSGWVYEGYAEEIISVLCESKEFADCFYIVSPKFDWFIVHDYIDECAVLYRK